MAVFCVHGVDLVTAICNECFPDPHACSFNRLPEFHNLPISEHEQRTQELAEQMHHTFDVMEQNIKNMNPVPDEIDCTVVASFECPTCHHVMVREHLQKPVIHTTYYCCNSDCELNKVRYYAPQIHMLRVGAIEYW